MRWYYTCACSNTCYFFYSYGIKLAVRRKLSLLLAAGSPHFPTEQIFKFCGGTAEGVMSSLVTRRGVLVLGFDFFMILHPPKLAIFWGNFVKLIRLFLEGDHGGRLRGKTVHSSSCLRRVAQSWRQFLTVG